MIDKKVWQVPFVNVYLLFEFFKSKFIPNWRFSTTWLVWKQKIQAWLIVSSIFVVNSLLDKITFYLKQVHSHWLILILNTKKWFHNLNITCNWTHSERGASEAAAGRFASVAAILVKTATKIIFANFQTYFRVKINRAFFVGFSYAL